MQPRKYFQDLWPGNTCFGCGVANADGLHIKSRWSADGQYVVAEYKADPKYSAFPGVMYGGTIASLIDCHSMWTAVAFAFRAENREMGTMPVIPYVTGKIAVTYLKQTPLDKTVYLKAWVAGDVGKKTTVLSELGPEGLVTATGVVTAIRIETHSKRSTK